MLELDEEALEKEKKEQKGNKLLQWLKDLWQTKEGR